jgi:hypothetical protein
MARPLGLILAGGRSAWELPGAGATLRRGRRPHRPTEARPSRGHRRRGHHRRWRPAQLCRCNRRSRGPMEPDSGQPARQPAAETTLLSPSDDPSDSTKNRQEWLDLALGVGLRAGIDGGPRARSPADACLPCPPSGAGGRPGGGRVRPRIDNPISLLTYAQCRLALEGDSHAAEADALAETIKNQQRRRDDWACSCCCRGRT